MATLPDGYRSAEIQTGNRIHIADLQAGGTLCGRAIWMTLPQNTRFEPDCPTCIRRLIQHDEEN